jgi:hypothetical protein
MLYTQEYPIPFPNKKKGKIVNPIRENCIYFPMNFPIPREKLKRGVSGLRHLPNTVAGQRRIFT